MDMALNGNHEIYCPECGHVHCRVVKDGIVTEDRWDQRNGSMGTTAAILTTNVTNSSTSTYATYNGTSNMSTATGSATNYMMYQSWMDTTIN